MGRTRSRVLLGACLAAVAAVNTVALAEEAGEQYALLAPRRRLPAGQESPTESSTPPTSAASEMTLQQPTTAPNAGAPDANAADANAVAAPDASSMPAPEIPPELQEPAPEIPLEVKGYAGPSSLPKSLAQNDFLPIPDRWRIGFPEGYKPEVGGFGHVWDPYNQNVLKGDYPFWGNDKFIVLTATNDTIFETRRLPNPSGVSSRSPDSIDFFGNGKQTFINENLILSASIFKGDAGYRPRDWEIRITPVINYNYVQLEEVGLVDANVEHGRYRHDNWVGLQEAFVEARLPYESRNFDFTSIRAGIQPFQADFKGFLFADNNLGLRLFGNKDNNRIQYNLAWFHQLEKDTNSGLNSYTMRDQNIFIANVFFQDSLKYFHNHSTNPNLLGLTTELTFAANIDHSGHGIQKDDNGFIVRPQPIGSALHDKDVNAYYLGVGADGHIGRYNLSTQFYQAIGTESFNAIAGRGTDINAQFFSIELSYDQDWIRYRASFLYASGDHDPKDGNANGFDSIFDNPNFAGGGFSFFTRQAIALTGAGVNLVQRNSFLPDLRTSKEQGQANFVNPGLLLYNVGADFDITPKLKAITNVSFLQFADTKSLQLILFDDKIGRNIGIDYSLGLEYRPFLNNNVICILGAAALQPMGGYRDLFQSTTEYSLFASITLTY